jgi:hypothetical protein
MYNAGTSLTLFPLDRAGQLRALGMPVKPSSLWLGHNAKCHLVKLSGR